MLQQVWQAEVPLQVQSWRQEVPPSVMRLGCEWESRTRRLLGRGLKTRIQRLALWLPWILLPTKLHRLLPQPGHVLVQSENATPQESSQHGGRMEAWPMGRAHQEIWFGLTTRVKRCLTLQEAGPEFWILDWNLCTVQAWRMGCKLWVVWQMLVWVKEGVGKAHTEMLFPACQVQIRSSFQQKRRRIQWLHQNVLSLYVSSEHRVPVFQVKLFRVPSF